MTRYSKQKNKRYTFDVSLIFWEVGDKILTNYAYDVYEMSPYLIEMKSWLVELDEQKKDKERPIII